MAKHRSGDTPSDRRGRTLPGRARDRARGADEDHGTPHEAGGRRADRRATRTQTVRVGLFGGVSTSRHDRDIPDISTRWRRR